MVHGEGGFGAVLLFKAAQMTCKLRVFKAS